MEYAESRIQVGDHKLRYVEAGEGEPLIWLHGGFGLHTSAGTDLLTNSFRFVAFELPGFGSSVHLDTAGTFDELSEQVAEGIQALGISRYLLHGSSFGAATALHLALNHPDRVKRLILESPAAFRPTGWTPPDVETIRRALFSHPERARRAQIDPEVMQQQRAFANRLSLTLALDRESLLLRLEDMHVPTLVVFGDADTLTPPELASLHCDNAPDCTSVVIDNAAHVVSSDQPEAYATAVRDFAMRAQA
jgi:pimeloyl-ACP methyl ester carboxylesterase